MQGGTTHFKARRIARHVKTRPPFTKSGQSLVGNWPNLSCGDRVGFTVVLLDEANVRHPRLFYRPSTSPNLYCSVCVPLLTCSRINIRLLNRLEGCGYTFWTWVPAPDPIAKSLP